MAKTLRELLTELREGFELYVPILVRVEEEPEEGREQTIERTVTIDAPLDWVKKYTQEYGDDPYILLGPNAMATTSSVTIGRSRQCDVKVDSESVSKLHARLISEPAVGSYYILDESSRNGTWINGQPLVAGVRMAIWPGAYVSFGDAMFVFIDPNMLRKLSRLAT